MVLILVVLLWRQDAMLRQVAGVQVNSIRHISALEEGLDGRDRNVSAELSALREEVLLSSEWVTSLQRTLAQRSRNESLEASGLRAGLAGLAARLSLAEAAASEGNRSQRLEAAEAAATQGRAAARRLARQHRGVLAVEEALARQLERQRREAAAGAAAAAARLAELRAELAAQRRALAALEARPPRPGLRAAAAGAEGGLAAALERQARNLTELRAQLRRQQAASALLQADVDREGRLYLDLAARVAVGNGSSRAEAERLVRRSLGPLASQLASQGRSLSTLEEEVARERTSSRAREEAMVDDLSAKLEVEQKKLAKEESSSTARDTALETELSQQQQDTQLRTQALGELLSKRASDVEASEASTQARVARLEEEVTRQHDVQAGVLRGGLRAERSWAAAPGGAELGGAEPWMASAEERGSGLLGGPLRGGFR